MQLLIIIPKQPSTTGNHVTAKRFVSRLRPQGWEARIVETEPDSPQQILQALQRQTPHALLLLHAYRSGQPWLAANTPAELPVALLMTGTDLNEDCHNLLRAEVIQRVRKRVAVVIVQNHLSYEQLRQSANPLPTKLRLLPPGIRLGRQSYPLRKKLCLDDKVPVMLHPAGIRTVKGNLELLSMCDQLAEQQLPFQLAFCGPILEQAYAKTLFSRLETRPWADYLGEIPKMAIADTMRQADIILNNSTSEGIANALVEAAALGRPILASDIIGNRAVVKNGSNGLLFGDAKEFSRQAAQLLTDKQLRKQLSQAEPFPYSADRESAQLAKILNEICAKTKSPTKKLSVGDE